MAKRFLSNVNINDQYTLPSSDGTSGQIIQTDGAGSLSFIDNAADEARKIIFTVKNKDSISLSKGTVVHASPSANPPSGNIIEVIRADSNNSSKMPAIGVLNETLAVDAEGECVMLGSVSGIATNSFSIGDELYVSTTAGEFTATKPTATTEEVQKIAIVIKSHSTNGLIEVFGAGRSNDVPNLLTRDITIDGADFYFGNADQIRMGDSIGLRLQHNGSNSFIDTEIGNMYFRAEANDSDMAFQADDGNGGNANYFYLDGSLATHDGTNTTQTVTVFPDNSKIQLGDDANGDFRLFHNGTSSFIVNNTGDIEIINYSDDKDIIFKSDNGTGAVATYFKLDGSLVNGTTTLGAVNFPDKSKIFMGTGSDLRIYHDGSNSYIEQATASNLIIRNTGAAEVEIKSNRKVNIYIDQNNDDTPNSFNILSNVDAYAADDVIFEVTQTGNVVADGRGTFDDLELTSGADHLTITESDGDWTIKNTQQNNGIKIYDGTGGVDINYNGSSYFEVDATGVHTAANIDFYVDTNLIYADATNNRVGIGKTAPDYKLEVNGQIASNNYIIAGLGNGGVAFTHNDGFGNANVTFNHVSGIPEQDGSSGRIVVTTDSTTAKMTFELKDDVTSGVSVDPPQIMELYSSSVVSNVQTKVRATAGGILSLQRNDTSIIDGNPLGRLVFSGDDPTDDVFNSGAEIRGEAAGTWSTDNYPSELQFYTTATNTLGLALKLDSSQNATFAGKILVGTGATAAASLNAYTQTVSANLYSALRIIENSAASSYWDIGATGGTSPDLNFYVNGGTTPKLTIDGSGNVGIGVTSPFSPLHVDGGLGGPSTSGNMSSSGFIVSNSTGGRAIQIGTDSGDSFNYIKSSYVNNAGVANELRLYNGAINTMTLSTAGNVGIGTTSPSSLLTLNAASGGALQWQYNGGNYLRIETDSGGGSYYAAAGFYHRFFTSGSERMRIDSSGNVGIGTTSPNDPFHLAMTNGAIRIDAETDRNHILSRNSNDSTWRDLAISAMSGQKQLVLTTGGNVGIGTTSPSEKLEITGSTATAADTTLHLKLPTGNITAGVTEMGNILFSSSDASSGGTGSIAKISTIAGDGTNAWIGSGRPTDLAFFTQPIGSSSTLVEAMRIDQDGNIGIGETSPDTALDVVGGNADSVVDTLTLKNDNTGNSAGAGINFVVDGGNDVVTSAIYGQRTASAYHQGSLQFLTRDASGGGLLERMRINSSGRVGIGTTSPGRLLHLYGSVEETLRIDNSGNSAGIHFRGTGVLKGILGFSNGSSIASAADANDIVLRAEGSNKIHLGIGGAVTLTTTSNSVGIGTTSPDARLEVVKDVDNSTNTGTDGNATQILHNGNASGTAVLKLRGTGSNSGAIVFGGGVGASTDKFNIISRHNNTKILTAVASGNVLINSGNVGIGVTSPTERLQVYESGLTAYKSYTSTNAGAILTAYQSESAPYTKTTDLVAGSDGTVPSEIRFLTRTNGESTIYERMRIDSSGNVGIGTDDPLGRLHLYKNDHTLIRIVAGDSSIAGIDFGKASDIDDARIRFYNSTRHMEFFVANGERMRINSSGNIGIGTTSPSTKLEVSSTSFNDHITLTRSSDELGISVSGGQLLFEGGVSPFGNDSEDLGRSDKHWNEIFVGDIRSSGNLILKTNGDNERMRIDSSGNVGIGTTSPGSRRLNVVTSDSGNDVGFESTMARTSGSNYSIRGLANGSGAAHNIGGFFEATGATTNTSLWAYNGRVLLATQNTTDFVGIGTASPSVKLDVAGTARVARILSTDDSVPLVVENSSAATARIGFKGTSSTSDYHVSVGANGQNYTVYTADTERMRIDSSGNLGIGQTGPTTHINSGSFFKPDSSGKFLTLNGGANGSFIMLESSSTTDNDQIGGVYFTATGGQADAHKQVAGIDAIAFAHGTTSLNGADLRFFTKPSGAGAGVDSPALILQHNNNATFAGDITMSKSTSGGLYIKTTSNVEPFIALFRNNASNGIGVLRGIDGGHLYIDTGATGAAQSTKMVIQAGGNVGIGVTSPNAKLSLAGGSNINSQNSILYIDTNSYYASGADRYITSSTAARYFQLNGEHIWSNAASGTAGNAISFAERMRIANDGKVGIGLNSSLGYKLNVAGSVYASGDFIVDTFGDTYRIGADTYTTDQVSGVMIRPADNSNPDSGVPLLIVRSGGGSPRLFVEHSGTTGTSNNKFTVGAGASRSDGNVVISSNGDTYFNGGDVGIGTTSPNSILHVGTSSSNTYSSTITKGSNMKGIINTLSSNVNDMVGIYFATGATTEGQHWSGITGSRTDSSSHWGTQLNFYTHNNDVANLNDATQKMVIKGDGNVGIGETNPLSDLTVRSDSSGGRGGEISIVNYASTAVGNEAALNFGLENSTYQADFGNAQIKARVNNGSNAATDMIFSLWNGSGFGEKMRITSSGNVGIDVSAPDSYNSSARKLVVGGSGDSGITISTSSTNMGTLMFADGTGGTAGYRGRVSYHHNGDYMRFDTAASEKMRIDSSGNVGIGTTSPGAAKLYVNQTEGWTGTQYAIFANTYSVFGNLRIAGNDAARSVYQQNDANLGIGTQHNRDINFFTNTSSTRMTITGGGNVGIGTTTPSGKLNVFGATGLPATSGTTFTGTMRLQVAGYGTTLDFGAEGPATGKQWLQATDAGDLSITYPLLLNPNGGNVGIGTTDLGTEAKLAIGAISSSEGGQIVLHKGTNGTYAPHLDAFFSGGVDYLRILRGTNTTSSAAPFVFDLTNTRVGIGDTTPSYKLDVAGVIRATGDIIAFSDKRVKENIKTIDNSLEKVNKLRGVEFNKIGEDKKSIGVIAQEIEKILPEVVSTDDDGMKSVAYGNITGVLIEAIKELKQEIEILKTQINK